MIILTQPNISKVNPKKQSSTVKYGSFDFCLAEVKETGKLPKTEKGLKELGIDFWWELSPGNIDVQDWPALEKYKGGLIEGVEWVLGLSKEKNIAMSIYEISNSEGVEPFTLWEKAILNN